MDRNQIDKKYKWGIESIYSDSSLIKEDMDKALSLIDEIIKYKDVELNENFLYEMISLEMSINRILEKLEAYVSLLCDEDTSNNKNQELKEEVSNLVNKFISEAYFTDVKILKLEYSTIKEFISLNSKLEEYEIYLENLFRFKKYTLSDKEEKIISSLSKALGNNYDTYELLKDSDMTFPLFKVDDKEYKLDNNLYSLYMESDNREVREKAFKTLYEKYKSFKNVFANLIISNVKEEDSLSKIRGYNSSLEKSMYKDEVNVSVYNNLVDTVNANLDVLHKYYALKKKVLGLDELHLYDVYTDMIQNSEFKYSFDDALEIVTSALSILGEEYISVLKKGIEDRWIDVYPSRGKRTGGYSSGSYDTNPYILLNYQDKYDDMSTLAHELGHSMHSYYTRNNNPYQYGYYSILVAEVASTVNELLLAKYVMNNTDDKNLKLFILNRILELFRATVYRQTMFSTFEKTIYEYVQDDKPLTADILGDIYYDLNKKYFGDDVVVDDEIRYEWERIPHFYYNFYVYKYATGLSSACYIVNGLMDGTIKTSDYLEFLKCGKSKSPLDSLKVAGVDLTDESVISNGIKMFESTIKEFEEMYFN
ncbi:MAG: oligoendopeptidase F [Bacilli bacterium]|nr:oligoendopeptidase F [Bacilli bacterium]